MVALRKCGCGNNPTKLPSHGGQLLDFVRDVNFVVGRGLADSFNYIAPTPKYNPANFQPGTVYGGGEAASIGHQPYAFNQAMVGYHTPKIMDWKTLPSYKGTQSAASYAIAQQTMSQMIALRSVNAGVR